MRRAGARCRRHPKHREASRREDDRPVADPRVGPGGAPPARPPSLALPAAEVHGTEKGAPAQSVGRAVLHQGQGSEPVLDQELSLRKKKRYSFGRKSRRFLEAWVRRDERVPSSCPYLQAGPLSQLCSGTGTQNRGSRDRSLWPREYGGSFLCLCVPWGAPGTPQCGKERPSFGEEQTQACLREQMWDITEA